MYVIMSLIFFICSYMFLVAFIEQLEYFKNLEPYDRNNMALFLCLWIVFIKIIFKLIDKIF
ncbi:hypothetical protein [Cetobacterium sp.]|uniref:hypothetical protein n=1 Tax=Cetobacterium sp. TaxID=2071632 RepID=UPI003F3338A5